MFSDDDSDTATEGEEEIRARELRKQEVRVEPPIVQTDTGTDTEVKPPSTLLVEPKSCSSELPDILSNHESQLKLDHSSDNLSEAYNSAESGDLNSKITKTDAKLSSTPKTNALMKSATVGSLTANKVKRNFVIPPKEQRKGFGKEFIPAFKPPEPTPLLIIKRTPSKINLPPEVGKPKVALKTNIEGAKKYFGDVNKPPPKPKPILKRCETLNKDPPVQKKLVKQVSLPEKQSDNFENEKSFNFEPEDSDLNKVDSYIEDLLANKEELMKPIDPNKYKISFEDDEEEKVSSSIEDLLKALETETKPDDLQAVSDKPDEKIEDLLHWMDSLDHQTQDRKVYRSYSDVKYKNLERILKAPKRADSVISKIPKDNISYFEKYMAGKKVEETPQEEKGFKLVRSKTDINFNRGRSSVDLDAVTNVDIKKVLMKFEMQSSQDDVRNVKEFLPRMTKRKSFSNFKCKSEERGSEEEAKKISKSDVNNGVVVGHGDTLSSLLKDIENFVDNTIENIGVKESEVPVEGIQDTSKKDELKSDDDKNVNDTCLSDQPESSKKRIENVSENFKFLENIVDNFKPLQIEKVDDQNKTKDSTVVITGTPEDTKQNAENILNSACSSAAKSLEACKKLEADQIITESANTVSQNTECFEASSSKYPDVFSASSQQKALQVDSKNKKQISKDTNLRKPENTQKSPMQTNEKCTGASKGAIMKNSENRNELSIKQNKYDVKNRKSFNDYENLKYSDKVNSNKKSLSQSKPDDVKHIQDKNEIAGVSNEVIHPEKYSASVTVTETRIFPQVPESNSSRPKNVEALYAKVNKNRPKYTTVSSPLAPQRSKKLTNPTPQRPMRQKSFEGKNKDQNKLQPVAPQRKKSTTASPQLKRKNTPPKSVETVSNIQKSQNIENKSSENTASPRDKYSKPSNNNNNNKDCCIQ